MFIALVACIAYKVSHFKEYVVSMILRIAQKPAETLQKPCRNPPHAAETLQKPCRNPAETLGFCKKSVVSANFLLLPSGVRVEIGHGGSGPTYLGCGQQPYILRM